MQDLKSLLETLEIPIAYDHFNTPTTPPFIVYRRYAQNNIGADNTVYKTLDNYYITLCTEYKDIDLEHRLEELLQSAEIYYNVENETYIDDEQMYEIIYTINIEGADLNLHSI